MKPIERLARIERTREELLGRVRALPHDARARSPREGKWSILQIVDHLVAAEEDVFGDPDRLAELAARPRSIRHRIMFWIVMFILRFDIPVKVPSTGMLPKGRDLEALERRWVELHEGVRDFVGGLSRDGERAAIFAHPVAGPLTTGQMLFMLDVHLQRHARQIDGLARRADADAI